MAEKFKNVIPTEELRHLTRDLQRMEVNFRKHSQEHERSRRTVLETWSLLTNQYHYLAKFAKAVLVLPSSTVPVECLFSQMQDFATPKRNRLNVENLEARLLIFLTNGDFSFDLTEKIIERKD